MVWHLAITLMAQIVSKEDLINRMLLNYSTITRPGVAAAEARVECGTVPPDNVTVQFHAKTLPVIDQVTQHYMIEGFWRVWWQDQRLAFDPATCGYSRRRCVTGTLWTASPLCVRKVDR